MNDLSTHKIFQKLSKLGLNKNEYVIFGSGVMFALGIRSLDELDDIDLVVNSEGWNKIKNMASIEVAKDWRCEFIQYRMERLKYIVTGGQVNTILLS